MGRYNAGGAALDWLESYTEARKEFLQMHHLKSVCLNIICGVPQGSVLGLKLFILHYQQYMCQMFLN